MAATQPALPTRALHRLDDIPLLSRYCGAPATLALAATLVLPLSSLAQNSTPAPHTLPADLQFSGENVSGGSSTVGPVTQAVAEEFAALAPDVQISVATPANMVVMGPGGYQFGDYAKLGMSLMLLYLLVAVFLVPFWWPF